MSDTIPTKILDALADCYLFLLARRRQRATRSEADSPVNIAIVARETGKDQPLKQEQSALSPDQKPNKQDSKS